MATVDVDARGPRSGFITGLAWTFIILGGLSTLIAIVQNVMLEAIAPAGPMRDALMGPGAQGLPAFARLMFENFRLIFWLFLILSAASFAAGIGLLRRQNWARIVAIVFMVLGVVWNLAGLVIPFVVFPSFPGLSGGAPGGFQDEFESIVQIMTVFSIVIAIVFSALFAWAVKRLCSAPIRREFGVE